MHVAIAAVETSSIAQGTVAADAILKTAEVEILELGALSPGKFWILIGGEVATVRASIQRGVALAGETLRGQRRSDVIATMVQNWNSREPDQALAWALAQPAGTARDRMLSSLSRCARFR